MENTNKSLTHISLYRYAGQIKRDWSNMDYGAKPYVSAMFDLDQITENYGQDTARSIVLYFLSNARSWRGEVAKQVKAELKKIANCQ